MVHASFTHWVAADVLPLQLSHPTWHRLDGWDGGGNRKIVGRFYHNGQSWAVHGDTRFDPIMVAYQAIQSGQVPDPFDVEPTEVNQCLVLKPNLWNTNLHKYKYFYVYK